METTKSKKKICFCASSGGHFKQLMQLSEIMDENNSFIVTEQVSDINTSDIVQKVYYIEEINRKTITMKQIIQNWKAARKILKTEKPDIIISTGVLATIPLCILAKLHRKKIIYIESFAKVKTGTMTGKLMYKIADKFYVQWPQMLNVYPKSTYIGGLY